MGPLHSVMGMEYGSYIGRTFNLNPRYHEMEDRTEALGKVCLGQCSEGMAVIRPYPGMGTVCLDEGITDVILSTYHSGTLPERIIRTSGLLKECSEKGIDVWITGCDPAVTYSGMAGLEGVNIPPMMTEISAFIKIWMFRRSGRDMSLVSEPLGGDLSA